MSTLVKCPKCGVEGEWYDRKTKNTLRVWVDNEPHTHVPGGVACLEYLVARLQAIVDKLPKDPSGNVLHVGMNCFVLDGADGRIIRDDVGIAMIEEYGDGDSICHLRDGDGEEWEESVDNVFATREAAEAARKQAQENNDAK